MIKRIKWKKVDKHYFHSPTFFFEVNYDSLYDRWEYKIDGKHFGFEATREKAMERISQFCESLKNEMGRS